MKIKTLVVLKALVLLAMTFLFLCLSSFRVAASESMSQYCAKSALDTGECPEDLCYWQCVYKHELDDVCVLTCLPKSCMNLDVEECPEQWCQVMTGCEGEEVCFNKPDKEAPLCGDIGYGGKDVQCCEGLVRRCGIEFFDGTCDMEGRHSIYAVPICIPCGNGICNQFENRCNCPEDCGGGDYGGEKFEMEKPEKDAELEEESKKSDTDMGPIEIFGGL